MHYLWGSGAAPDVRLSPVRAESGAAYLRLLLVLPPAAHFNGDAPVRSTTNEPVRSTTNEPVRSTTNEPVRSTIN